MIAMQYSFTLPADYDMTIIDRRIAERGRSTDGFPGLVFKAYCSSRKAGPQSATDENRYAPFYLWQSCEAMNAFLCGPGFAGVSQAFGWPAVRTWSVLHAELGAEAHRAVFATREIVQLAPYADLDDMRRAEGERAKQEVEQGGALAALAAVDPHGWTIVRFQLWEQEPSERDCAGQCAGFRVGHVSTG